MVPKGSIEEHAAFCTGRPCANASIGCPFRSKSMDELRSHEGEKCLFLSVASQLSKLLARVAELEIRCGRFDARKIGEYPIVTTDTRFLRHLGDGTFVFDGPRERLSLVRTALPLPVGRSFYFEVTIVKSVPLCPGVARGPDDDDAPVIVTIGLMHPDEENLRLQPGWKNGSIGFHSDDGKLFTPEKNEYLGPPSSYGDTLGCGVRANGSVVFIRNGAEYATTRLRLERRPLSGQWVPSVGVRTPCEIVVNLGQKAFVADRHALDI